MVLEPMPPGTDNHPYLVKGTSFLEDIVLEGQLAARSALQEKQTNPVRGILAFVLPHPGRLAPNNNDSHLGDFGFDRLVVEPELDFTRSWVNSLRQQQQKEASTNFTDTSAQRPVAQDASPLKSETPEALLSQPNVRGIRIENARPSQLGLELLWFLRSLTNGDVKTICSSLEQTVWTQAGTGFQGPCNVLDSLASGGIMEVPDVTSYSSVNPPDYTYVLDFIHNDAVVFSPDGKKHEIELRRFCPRFLSELGQVKLSPIDSGLGSTGSDSGDSDSDMSSLSPKRDGYFDDAYESGEPV